MKTLLIASAFLLSAAGADGSTGGEAQAEAKVSGTDSPVNETPTENAPAIPETIGAGSETNAPVADTGAPNPVDLTELDEDFSRRLAAERVEFARIRELTPIQEIEMRACTGASHLGLVIGTPDGIRCIPLADWRTVRVCMKAGDHAQLVVLAGEGLATWEHYRMVENRQKDRAIAAGAPAQAVDPLEATQPVAAV